MKTILALTLALPSFLLAGTVYYVDSSTAGSDTNNDGTSKTTPFKHLQRIVSGRAGVNSAGPGDIIYVRGGEHRFARRASEAAGDVAAQTDFGVAGRAVAYFGVSGTAAEPITIRACPVGEITVTIANPAVFSKTGHGLAVDRPIRFSTTGRLPTGLTAGTTYYVRGVTTDTFEVSLTKGGTTSVTTTGSQTGVHTAEEVPVFKGSEVIPASSWAQATVSELEGLGMTSTQANAASGKVFKTTNWQCASNQLDLQSTWTANNDNSAVEPYNVWSSAFSNPQQVFVTDTATNTQQLLRRVNEKQTPTTLSRWAFYYSTFAVSTANTIHRAAHGLQAGDKVRIFKSPTAALPTELLEATDYWVVNPQTDTFQLSDTQGGSPKTISTTTATTHSYKWMERTFKVEYNNVITRVGHGLQPGDVVRIGKDPNASLQTGLAENTDYWVVNAIVDSFQLATTRGGSPISISPSSVTTNTLKREEATGRFLEAGTFYYKEDLASDTSTIYVWLTGNGDPSSTSSGLVLEASTSTHLFWPRIDSQTSARFIHLDGLTFMHSNTVSDSAGHVAMLLRDNAKITNCRFLWMDYVGMGLWADTLLENSEISYCSKQGLGIQSPRVTIRGCKFEGNYNQPPFNPDWAIDPVTAGAGAIKSESNGITSATVVIENCHFLNNRYATIWFDGCTSDESWDGHPPIVVRNNYIHDNQGGVFFEISRNALITNNVFDSNLGSSIAIADSRNAVVTNNLIAGTHDGSHALAMMYTGRPDGQDLANNTITNNVFYKNLVPRAVDACRNGFMWSGGIPAAEVYNNVIDHNIYYAPDSPHYLRFLADHSVYTDDDMTMPDDWTFEEWRQPIDPTFASFGAVQSVSTANHTITFASAPPAGLGVGHRVRFPSHYFAGQTLPTEYEVAAISGNTVTFSAGLTIDSTLSGHTAVFIKLRGGSGYDANSVEAEPGIAAYGTVPAFLTAFTASDPRYPLAPQINFPAIGSVLMAQQPNTSDLLGQISELNDLIGSETNPAEGTLRRQITDLNTDLSSIENDFDQGTWRSLFATHKLRHVNWATASKSVSGSGSLASAAAGELIVSAGSAAGGYSRTDALDSVTDPSPLSGAGINFSRPISFSFQGTLLPANNSKVRILVGEGNGAPKAANQDALSDKGFGVEFFLDGTVTKARLIAHNGTGFVSSASVTLGSWTDITSIVVRSEPQGNPATSTKISLWGKAGTPAPRPTGFPELPLVLENGPVGTQVTSGGSRYLTFSVVNDSGTAPDALKYSSLLNASLFVE